jgi:cell division protein FtsB
MAGRRFRNRANGALTQALPIFRVAGRALTAAFVLLLATLIVIQYGRAIHENIVAVRQLHALRADIAALQQQRDAQVRQIRRLSDPQGVLPEIHDRLRLVRPGEVLIFVSPAPSPHP